MSARVLFVDDDAAMCKMVHAHLVKRHYDVETSEVAADAFETLRSRDFDVVVTDLQMRGMNGLELCERIVADRADIPVIVITAFGNLQLAIAAIRVGAYDFVPKPFEIEQLCIALERAVQHRTLRDEVLRLREVAGRGRPSDELIGRKAARPDGVDDRPPLRAEDAELDPAMRRELEALGYPGSEENSAASPASRRDPGTRAAAGKRRRAGWAGASNSRRDR